MPITKVTSISIDETLNNLQITGNDNYIVLRRVTSFYPGMTDNSLSLNCSELESLSQLLMKIKLEIEKLKKER